MTSISNIPFRVFAFVMQITATGIYNVVLLRTASIKITPTVFAMPNCTTQLILLSDVYQKVASTPICFTTTVENTQILFFLREDLTCAVYQPLLYLAQIHQEVNGTCAAGLLWDEANPTATFHELGNDGNSTVIFAALFHYLKLPWLSFISPKFLTFIHHWYHQLTAGDTLPSPVGMLVLFIAVWLSFGIWCWQIYGVYSFRNGVRRYMWKSSAGEVGENQDGIVAQTSIFDGKSPSIPEQGISGTRETTSGTPDQGRPEPDRNITGLEAIHALPGDTTMGLVPTDVVVVSTQQSSGGSEEPNRGARTMARDEEQAETSEEAQTRARTRGEEAEERPEETHALEPGDMAMDPVEFVPPIAHQRPITDTYRAVAQGRSARTHTTVRQPRSPAEFEQELDDYIKKQQLEIFYPTGGQSNSTIRALAGEAARVLATESDSDSSPSGEADLANLITHNDSQSNDTPTPPFKDGRYYGDICKTALYKIVLLIDDSGSMKDIDGPDSVHSPRRCDILKRVLERITKIHSDLDPEGLSVRFLNYPRSRQIADPRELDGIRDVSAMRQILGRNKFKGGTELGGMLLDKVLEPLVFDKAREDKLERPVLISIITDGEPDDVPDASGSRELQNVIAECKRRLREEYPQFGENAVAFHITQIGNSSAADNFLNNLAQDPRVRDYIYCTSEHIDDQHQRYHRDSALQAYNHWWVNELMVAIKG